MTSGRMSFWRNPHAVPEVIRFWKTSFSDIILTVPEEEEHNPYERREECLKSLTQKGQYDDLLRADERQKVQKHDLIFAHGGGISVKKYITTYRQDFCQLPKLKIDGIIKKNMKPWKIENKIQSTYTESVSKDTLEIIANKRSPGYETETSACFKAPAKEAMLTESQRCATPRDFSVDFFKPNLSSKLYPIFKKGYPPFAVPEYTDIPPQLARHMAAKDDPNAMAFRPLLPTRFVRH